MNTAALPSPASAFQSKSAFNKTAAVTESSTVLRLPARATRSLRLASDQTARLRLLTGHAWVTMENDPADYAASAGDSFQFPGPGLLVIEALEEETVFSLVA